MFTANSISSMHMSRMMRFFRLRKIPTMLMANSRDPSMR